MVSDETAYRKYLAGDEAAAQLLVERYGDALTLYINGVLGDIHEAEDLMIEAFAHIFARERPIQDGCFKAYLYKTGRNLALRCKTRRRFFLPLEILYWDGLRPPFSPFALAAGVVIAGVVMRVQVFGPSPLMSGALALTFGALAYLCFSALQKEKRLRPYEIALLFEMSLQILLFVASEFIRDYTRFSLYYAVDILLTLTLVSFLPHILREEPHDLH